MLRSATAKAATLVVVGLLMVLLAAGASRLTPGHAEAPAPAQAPAPDLGIVLRGPGDVAVVTQAYEPGQTSGWHAHAGLHAVAVLSGELTVYDSACRPQRVVAGEPYVGGQQLHLARNETSEPVHMVVTYLNAVGPEPPRAGAPAGCSVR
jgi:quercetin dioxygenase-like cupin family protein